MKLSDIQITSLRNIHSLKQTLHPHINFIIGPNGSGKTSFLEAVYLLASGHSFRTREISALVSHGAPHLVVYANTIDHQSVCIQKSIHSPTLARINNQPCLVSSALALFMPCQVIYQDIFQFIESGPAVRRAFLDWGLFHVEHGYFKLWKEYRRALKHRNVLLKQKAKPQDLRPWNQIMSDLGEQLHALRSCYFEKLHKSFVKQLPFLTEVEGDLHYEKGWDKRNEAKSLFEVLEHSYELDLARAQTHYGAHHADLSVTSHLFKAKQRLSRGQQKMVLFALKFAQANLLKESCIFLIDDITSELDKEHLTRLLSCIQKNNHQFLITLRYHSKIIQQMDASHQVLFMNQGHLTIKS